MPYSAVDWTCLASFHWLGVGEKLGDETYCQSRFLPFIERPVDPSW